MMTTLDELNKTMPAMKKMIGSLTTHIKTIFKKPNVNLRTERLKHFFNHCMDLTTEWR